MEKRIENVTVLIDWGCAHRIVPYKIDKSVKVGSMGVKRKTEDPAYLTRCFRALQESISYILNEKFRKMNYNVSIRLYNGWHHGMMETAEYKAIRSVVGNLSARLGNVFFNREIGYSCDLLCGGRSRVYNTLRRQEKGKLLTQKMVDTSLVCDMLHLARTNRDKIVLVFTDDDDLLPGIITAEAWGASNFYIVTRRVHDAKCIDVDGLILRVGT